MCVRTVCIIVFHLHPLLSPASFCFALCGAERGATFTCTGGGVMKFACVFQCVVPWFACFVAGSAFSLFTFLSFSLCPSFLAFSCHSFRQRSGLPDLCHCAPRCRSINCSRRVVRCSVCSVLSVRHLLKPRPLLLMSIIPGESASSLAKVSSPRLARVWRGQRGAWVKRRNLTHLPRGLPVSP
jgi:hypothetical protein